VAFEYATIDDLLNSYMRIKELGIEPVLTLAGKQISALLDMIRSGGAYVNVHTTQNQNGQVRGQIS
jgi:hypothetical protein